MPRTFTALTATALTAAAAAALALGLAACTPPPATGAQLYGEYCAGCHGVDARGTGMKIDGHAPPDLTTLAARHGGAFPTEYVMSTIDGYARDETHGPMPIFGALLEDPVETWTDPDGTPTPTPRALIQLAAYIEGLQG